MGQILHSTSCPLSLMKQGLLRRSDKQAEEQAKPTNPSLDTTINILFNFLIRIHLSIYYPSINLTLVIL